jgi:hypothetical protein
VTVAERENRSLADLSLDQLEDKGVHRFLHEGGYSLVVLAEGELEFRHPWGNPIEPVPRPPPGDPERLLLRNEHLAIDAETCACRGDSGDRMDLDLTVYALQQIAG